MDNLKITLEINTENAQFRTDNGNPEAVDAYEVARQLEQVFQSLVLQARNQGLEALKDFTFKDYNGNKIGSVKIEIS